MLAGVDSGPEAATAAERLLRLCTRRVGHRPPDAPASEALFFLHAEDRAAAFSAAIASPFSTPQSECESFAPKT